jgi:hypothetical protein
MASPVAAARKRRQLRVRLRLRLNRRAAVVSSDEDGENVFVR